MDLLLFMNCKIKCFPAGKGPLSNAWLTFIPFRQALELWRPLSQSCSDCAQIDSTEHAVTEPAIYSFIHLIFFSFIYSSNETFIVSALVSDFELGAGDTENEEHHCPRGDCNGVAWRRQAGKQIITVGRLKCSKWQLLDNLGAQTMERAGWMAQWEFLLDDQPWSSAQGSKRKESNHIGNYSLVTLN